MNPAFTNLSQTKQHRILNAALKEFAENGYEQASTNKIVQQARIGKGMLFHYFNNKLDLYHDLINYAINVMLNEYFVLIDTKETDFIERLKQIARVKAEYLERHPNVSHFIAMVFLSDEVKLPQELEARLSELQKTGSELIYKNVDKNLFRDDIDVNKAFQLIRWAIEGYQNELMSQFKGRKIAHVDLQPYWEEFYGYLEVLKKTFYKEKMK